MILEDALEYIKSSYVCLIHYKYIQGVQKLCPVCVATVEEL